MSTTLENAVGPSQSPGMKTRVALEIVGGQIRLLEKREVGFERWLREKLM